MNMAALHIASINSLLTFYLVLLLLIHFQSRFCMKTTPRCLSNPCQNSATCYEDGDDYICHCLLTPIHYIGKNCDRLYDACSSKPCQQNAVCVSATGSPSFTCNCPIGYSGSTCETEIRECASNPCRNGSSCQTGPAGNTCVCAEGFTGAYCEKDINECASDPCQNGAVCLDGVNEYSCFCVPGYQGKHCNIEVDECASEPCQHGASCVNRIGRYDCVCQPGYTGINCELEIDECLSEPCLNGATCQDSQAGYLCICAPGFRGILCEINIDECVSQPCQNGGKCADQENGYSCNCSATGYTGLYCETYIPLCSLQPCLNNATCEDSIGNYTCHCWPGFEGSQCETDIHECSSGPCLHGGECIEQSWADLYGLIPELPSEFKYHQASGYVCRCQRGFTGTHCQDDINECDANPCQNGGNCENVAGSYICHCPPRDQHGIFYGGKNCTDVLLGCEHDACQNGATCIPYLRKDLHKYSCICPSGYTGSYCQLMTTFSFELSGYIHVTTQEMKDHFYNITLRFRTIQPNAVIFYRGNAEHFIMLKLLSGHLHSTFQMNDQPKRNLQILRNVSDGEWHTVETTLGKMVTLKLLDSSCSKRCTNQGEVGINSSQLIYIFQNTFIGGLPVDGGLNDLLGNTSNLLFEPYFVGCLQDVQVDSQIIILENMSSNSSLNVKVGCQKKDWCKNNPCQSRGRCINLWLNYHCECYRPYEGLNCSREYIAGRFGQEDSTGYAAFSVDETYGENVTISMFVRTRKSSGLILLLRNTTSHYVRIWLDNDRLKLQIENSPLLISEHEINDGNFHFISVKTEQGKADFFQSAQKLGSISFHPIRVQSGDTLFVGGLPEQQAMFIYGGYFKGCVQDLRLNTKQLEFYPIASLKSKSSRTLVNMTSGCTGDDICKLNPCKNGGVCYSVWDDFTCTCPPTTAGRTCEEVRWCELSPCPSEVQCQPVYSGFECIASARFKRDSVLSYRGNGKIARDLTNITFGFQTRATEATILHAEKEPEQVTISIQQSHLVFKLQSGNSFYTLSLISLTEVSDGRWHQVTLSMTAPTSQSSRWQMDIDEKEKTVTSTVTTGNLNFLMDETDIHLGGRTLEMGGDLTGCLGTVNISGISLSYFENADIHVKKPQQEQFIKISPKFVNIGCEDDDACMPSPCLNGGSCEDSNGLYHCVCPRGWTGINCENNIDDCISSPCIHGNCTDLIAKYECSCEPGYTGATCDVNIDDCQGHPCVNGATCIDDINGYSCICPANFTGRFCEYSRLPATLCGDEKENLTCLNGGNCTEKKGKMKCTCLPGITGERCELDIDECNSDPCLNGGLCQNLLNRFQCICDINFAGDRCEIDLKSDNLTSEVLISIGSIVMALLLVLFLLLPIFILTVKKRATQGTYSPSRQEKEGSRVELWNVMLPPQVERLI